MSEELWKKIEKIKSVGELIRYESIQRWVNGLPKSFYRKDGKVR